MSKMSRKKARKRRKHNQKKHKKVDCNKSLQDKRQVKFVAYMLEDDARDFSGVLCGTNFQKVIKPTYQTFDFDGVAYTRIALYVHKHHFYRAYRILDNSILIAVGSESFRSLKCGAKFSSLVSEENLCMVGQVVHETVDQFKGDARESTALSDSEILFYRIPCSSTVAVMVEIYTNDINREFARAVLQDGWMSERWGKYFKIVHNNVGENNA